uniref:Uncharacterized protein n=1 Tax=Oryza punctata TaxID=4537 RepID=A0A0E0MMD6_ORYPU
MKSNFSHLVLFFFCVVSLLTSPALAIRQGAFQAVNYKNLASGSHQLTKKPYISGGYRNQFHQLISVDYDPIISSPPQIHSVPNQHAWTGNHF